MDDITTQKILYEANMEEKIVYTKPIFIYDEDHKELMRRKIEANKTKIADVIKELLKK